MIRTSNKRLPVREGLLFIGDPHVEGRQPGFRCDDYPEVILEKIRWSLEYAAELRLQPVFLGDFFDKPRDNPNWIVGRLIEILMGSDAIGIYGNHDCAESELTDNDTLMLLVKAGCLRMVSAERPWFGEICGRVVVVGGSSYRQPVPHEFDLNSVPKQTLFDGRPLVVWITHHDVDIPGYDGGRFSPRPIENVDLVINGHIHRRLDPAETGSTTWMTPGNISRRSRSDAHRQHAPAVMQLSVTKDDYSIKYVTVPHLAAEQVFHSAVVPDVSPDGRSQYILGLKEMQARKTDSGAGLMEFLNNNIQNFEPPVAREIMILAEEIDNE